MSLKEHYKSGNTWMKIIEVGLAAFLASYLSVSGIVHELKGKVEQLAVQTQALAAVVDKHIQNYDVHKRK